jgi:sulfite reductase alpha subunit
VANCPAGAISWDPEKKELKIDGSRCKKSMHCIRAAFPAIKPGKERRVAVLVGGGSKGRYGPKLGWFIGYLKPDEVQKAIDQPLSSSLGALDPPLVCLSRRR